MRYLHVIITFQYYFLSFIDLIIDTCTDFLQ